MPTFPAFLAIGPELTGPATIGSAGEFLESDGAGGTRFTAVSVPITAGTIDNALFRWDIGNAKLQEVASSRALLTDNGALTLALGSSATAIDVTAASGQSTDIATVKVFGGGEVFVIENDGFTIVGAGTTSHSLGAVGDLLVSNSLEVNGTAFFDAVVTLAGDLTFNDDVAAVFGTSSDSAIRWETAGTVDALHFETDSTGRSILIIDKANGNADYGLAAQPNPTLAIYSATASGTATDEAIIFAHNVTDGVITTLSGNLNLRPAGITSLVNGLDIALGASAVGFSLTAASGHVGNIFEVNTFSGSGGDTFRIEDDERVVVGNGALDIEFDGADARLNFTVVGAVKAAIALDGVEDCINIGIQKTVGGNNLILCNVTAIGGTNADFLHGDQDDPTWWIHSGVLQGSATDEYGGWHHDRTDFIFESGKGDYVWNIFGAQLRLGLIVADTDGVNFTFKGADGGAHTSNNPDGGDLIFNPGDAGSGGAGISGIIRFGGDVLAVSNGKFRVVFSGATTDATLTEIFIGGVSNNRLVIPTDTVWGFKFKITGAATGGDQGDTASWTIEGSISNFGGTTALVSAVTKSTIGTSGVAAPDPDGWDLSVTADDTNDAPVPKVTGEASHNINWGGYAEYWEVAA